MIRTSISIAFGNLNRDEIALQYGIQWWTLKFWCRAPGPRPMLTLKNLLIPKCKNEHFVQKFTWTLLKKNLANLAPRQIFIHLPACCFIICVRTSFSWRGPPDSIQCYVGGCANFHLGIDVRACNIGRGTGVRGDKRQWYSFMCLC